MDKLKWFLLQLIGRAGIDQGYRWRRIERVLDSHTNCQHFYCASDVFPCSECHNWFIDSGMNHPPPGRSYFQRKEEK